MSNAPFPRDGSDALFVVQIAGDTLAAFHGLVRLAAESPAQSHRVWHLSADGHLLTTRWDFLPHHSRFGAIDVGMLRADFLVEDLADTRCASIAMMKAIASIDFDEEVTRWS